jgi:hypothetical protein
VDCTASAFFARAFAAVVRALAFVLAADVFAAALAAPLACVVVALADDLAEPAFGAAALPAAFAAFVACVAVVLADVFAPEAWAEAERVVERFAAGLADVRRVVVRLAVVLAGVRFAAGLDAVVLFAAVVVAGVEEELVDAEEAGVEALEEVVFGVFGVSAMRFPSKLLSSKFTRNVAANTCSYKAGAPALHGDRDGVRVRSGCAARGFTPGRRAADGGVSAARGDGTTRPPEPKSPAHGRIRGPGETGARGRASAADRRSVGTDARAALDRAGAGSCASRHAAGPSFGPCVVAAVPG